MKLRLLITEKCNRNCKGCCNKQHDLTKLSTICNFTSYDEIMVTGGEPLLDMGLFVRVITDIRTTSPNARIYVYTAYVHSPERLEIALAMTDGVTVTLHEHGDSQHLQDTIDELPADLFKGKSMRLNVFEGIPLPAYLPHDWHTRCGIRWIEDCPVPADEIFMRYELGQR